MKKEVVARTPQALAAIASPLRLEIVDWFQVERELSIRELAERLERKPSSITYHVRLLEQAGLLVEVKRRVSGKRPEAVYSLAALDARVGESNTDAATREYKTRVIRTLLRQAEREYTHALDEAADGRSEAPHATRQRARLTRAEKRAVHKHFDAIRSIFQNARKRRRGTSYSLTFVQAPVP